MISDTLAVKKLRTLVGWTVGALSWKHLGLVGGKAVDLVWEMSELLLFQALSSGRFSHEQNREGSLLGWEGSRKGWLRAWILEMRPSDLQPSVTA